MMNQLGSEQNTLYMLMVDDFAKTIESKSFEEMEENLIIVLDIKKKF